LQRQPDGSVKITGFDLASQILRGRNLKQAGFNADMVARLPQKNTSILFKDGEITGGSARPSRGFSPPPSSPAVTGA